MFNHTLMRKISEQGSQEANPSRKSLKKAVKDRDKVLKEILNFDNRYNMKFIALWAQTNNFKYWVNNHDT